VIAARRAGKNARCKCGESRPEALVTGRKPAICVECQRREQGKTTMDNHHVAGKRNSPVTICVPANDHLAELSAAQFDWPTETLRNPSGNQLLKVAASIRGYIDANEYFVETILRPLPELLEKLAEKERRKVGDK